MWIVLEGLDGSGKTTTARQLEARGWEYEHVGPPGQGGSFPELVKLWWEAEDRVGCPGTRIVWDRGHLGEQFCGPVRRGTQPTEAATNVLEAMLIDRQAEVWWLDPPADRLVSEVPLDQRASERMRLREACQKSRVPVRRFGSFGAAEAWAREINVPARLDPLDPAGVGTRRPRWWVLGEQPSASAYCGLPFVTPAGLDMLWPHVDPGKVRLSNVLLEDEDLGNARRGQFSSRALLLLRESWEALREPKVLALGGTAHAALLSAGVPVTARLRHPQYVRRFYHAEVGNWSREFKEIVR